MQNTILFVYNANSGIFNGLIDLMHKTFAPKTYPCDLCAITYGFTGMHSKWRSFAQTLPYPVLFLHKDELQKEYPEIQIELPAVVLLTENTNRVLITNADFKQLHTLEELMQHMQNVLQTITPNPPSLS